MPSEDEPAAADDELSDDPSPSDETSSSAEASPSPSDDEVVQTAAEAAENVIFSRLSNSAVRDFDVTVSFEDGVLDVDVYLNAPDARNEEKIAEDAVLAARSAVDDLFADAED